jgi:hypothetical protein
VDDVWITLVIPAVTALVLGAALVVLFRQRSAAMRRSAPRLLVEPGLDTPLAPAAARPARPWWGNPWFWVAVCAACALLGVFVAEGFLGGTFLFLPFVWIWRPRDAPPDPRSNGHGTPA